MFDDRDASVLPWAIEQAGQLAGHGYGVWARPDLTQFQNSDRSLLIAAAPISRLRQAGLRTTRPFYDTAFCQGIARFVDLDPPRLIRPW